MSISEDQIIPRVRRYLTEVVLEGDDQELEETSPLLEWGIINSFELVRLVEFIDRELHVRLPPASLTAQNFINLRAIAALVRAHAPPA